MSDVIWRRIKPFFFLQQGIVGVFSDCLYALTCDLCPCGKETRPVVHFRWSASASRNTAAQMAIADVMLADKEQICINRSGYQYICLFPPYFLFIYFFYCWDNEAFSLEGSKLKPFSWTSLKWKSKNICCICAKTNPVVFCFCSMRGRWDVFDMMRFPHCPSSSWVG